MMRRFKRDTADAGFTLVELLISSLLIVVVVAIAASIVRAAVTSQRTVSDVTAASSTTQVTVGQFINALRNSSGFRVDTVNTTDQLVQARVPLSETGGVTTWACQAWYFDNAKQQIRFQTSSSAITAPTATVLAGWRLFMSNVKPPSGSMFTVSGHTLTINLSAAVTKAPPLTVATTVVSRSENWTGDTCFTAPGT